MSEPNHNSSHEAASGAGHEPSDVSIGPLIQFGLVLAVFAGLVLVAVGGLLGYFDSRERELQKSAYPLATGKRTPPPEPQLEGIDMEYGKSRARLDSPRKPPLTPREKEAIKQAMDKLEGKLPVRSEAPGGVQRPPSDSNSARGAVKETP